MALSFVRKAEDIVDLKSELRERDSHMKVMAKIEMPSALKDIRNIIVESDGIMVARRGPWCETALEKNYPWPSVILSVNYSPGKACNCSYTNDGKHD